MDGGSHMIAGMREIVQSPVKSMHAALISFDPPVFGNQPETMLLNIKFVNGLYGQLSLGYASIDKDARKPKIYGVEGTIVLEKKALQRCLFSNGQSMIFQQGVYDNSFFTALTLIPCSWIISRKHSIHLISRIE